MLNLAMNLRDLSVQNIGAKAYNVAKCKTIVEGEENIGIPKSLVLTGQEVACFFYNNAKRQSILDDIRGFFGESKIIVRSSSLYEDSKFFSAAGQYETCMNLYETNDIEKAILKVRDSAFTASAKLYSGLYQKKCLSDDDMAVLIQEMIMCDYSGVLYTSNPLNRSNDMLVEFTKGLGDKVASGEKDSKTFALNSMCESVKNNKELLSLLNKLGIISRKLVNEFGCELDIEWGIRGNCLYIFQARPMFFCCSEISGDYDWDLVSHAFAIEVRVVSRGIAVGKAEDFFISDNMKKIETIHIPNHCGFLVNNGGLLSHAASLMRELGKPCAITDIGRLKKDEIYVLDGFKNELLPWEMLSFYEKSSYLWEAFYHIAKNVKKELLYEIGIKNSIIEHKYESVINDTDMLCLKSENYECYDQFSTTYDIDGDELINYNIIIRKQKTEKYIRLQIKHFDLSKDECREDKEILLYFDNEQTLEKFVQKFPIHSTGKQHRKVLKLNFNSYSVNLIQWSKKESYMTVESVSEEALLNYCKQINKNKMILCAKGGKEIFDELKIKLNDNI